MTVKEKTPEIDLERHMQFVDDLRNLLLKHYEKAPGLDCAYAGNALILEAINVYYQNIKDKDFKLKIEQVFNSILKYFMGNIYEK